MELRMQALEAAINYWRARQPARGNEYALSPPVSRLAGVYALMIYYRQDRIAEDRLEPAVLALIDVWRRDAAGIQGDSHA
ncbi:DUF3717 domain-containing protein [Janthinobacterium sp. GW460P]|uniref:DUF3717 domain-containing protein n=1 Tax=unclassified Janthinobacterium TaxID=2610881 RepID=UPI000A3287D6|nr:MULTISPECIES: DUF3717 domain-containing protein [unclassified Janthinobacterium]MCC7704420.1 DUF3717 domain-containing protein [Janthinobacterium sp. GW460P]MCC7709922.1 DUF3717 domain-containing protein [Janthinobacterium sp. GW460W]